MFFLSNYNKNRQTAKFTTNTISINYNVYGTGIPVLTSQTLVDFNYNYSQTGWIKSLSKNGFQVIGIDFRGYGESDKSNDSNFTARQT
jgi:alpha-beta hydrolase superfamily lysophospholipase